MRGRGNVVWIEMNEAEGGGKGALGVSGAEGGVVALVAG